MITDGSTSSAPQHMHEVVIGETPRTRAGYSLRVSVVHFHEQGARVRLIVCKDGQLVKKLDVTVWLLKGALPLLCRAVQTAGRP